MFLLNNHLNTPEETIEDMMDAVKDYAEEYREDFNRYSSSPNRAHHLPYIRHSAKVNYSNNGQICMALKEYYRAEPLLSPLLFWNNYLWPSPLKQYLHARLTGN